MTLSVTLCFADVSIDVLTRKGHRAGMPLSLRPRELDILIYLAQRPWEHVLRWDLYADVIGRLEHEDSNTLEVQVHRLRQTLGEPLYFPSLIATVPHRYMLCADVTLHSSSSLGKRQ